VREIILVEVETWDFVAEPNAKARNFVRLFSHKVDNAGRRSRLRPHIGFGYGKVDLRLYQALWRRAVSIDVEVRSVTL
jgi:hypothetical protein